MNELHDEIAELLGVYALDAVDVEERAMVEAHLAECPRCRAEVAEHREVASLLAQTGAPAPAGLWDLIAAELSPPAPPMRVQIASLSEVTGTSAPTAEAGPSASVASITDARRYRTRSRALLAAVAVAACIVALLGVVTVGQSNRMNRLETSLGETTIERMANDAVGDASLTVRLAGDAGKGEAVVRPNGQGYLILDDVPVPADGDVYQLWGKVDDTVLSLGTFGGDASVIPFNVDADKIDDIGLFAVTQERAPGVVASQNAPVLAGEV